MLINGEKGSSMHTQFEFTVFPQLETERFILRKGIMDDGQDILRLYSNENVVKYRHYHCLLQLKMLLMKSIGMRKF